MAGLSAANTGGLFDSAKVEKAEDFLADLCIGPPESSKKKDIDGLFASDTVFKPSVIGQSSGGSAKPTVVDTNQRRMYSNLHVNDSNDNHVNDLSVGKMLQREEYDYDTFGQSNVKQGGFTVKKPEMRTSADASIGKAQQDLDRLEELLNSSETTVKKNAKPKSVASTTAGTSELESDPLKSAAVDYDGLNLDDYINSQQTEDSGGLFD